MRLPATLTSLLYLIISSKNVSAGPLLPKDELQRDIDWVKHLFDRQAPCDGIYCGADRQYCCTGGSTCYTDVGNIAKCGAPTPGAFAAGASSLVYYTTTIVLTNLQTVTSTYSTLIGAPATTTQYLAQSTLICATNQDSCGALCCNHGIETCAGLGSCVSIGAMPTSTPYSAPLRPTGVLTTVVTAIVSPTTTQTFVPAQSGNSTIPIGATGGNSGLSAGAIAGIVIGVLAAVIILILICFCCVLRAGFDAILGIFGLGRKRREERVEITEERYSRRGSGSRRESHTGWFGGGRRTRVEEKKKSSTLAKEGGIIAGIALALAGLWAVLGFRKKQRAKPPRSDVSYTTYTDSYSGAGSSQSECS
jgi:hypothetical protein